jgi:ribonuclease VapC
VIAVDTSALIAIVLGERQAEACKDALAGEDELLISSVTVAESLIVGSRRNVVAEVGHLIDALGVQVVGVDARFARRVAEAYERWGRGRHPAALNFGDCFAYAVAQEHHCGLLYVGRDFSRTDVQGVL